MKHLTYITLALMLTGCAAMPELFKAVDDIATDDCITVKVDRDAFKDGQNVKINVDIDVESQKNVR